MISMKSKLTYALGFAIAAVMCGCGDDKSPASSSESSPRKTQVYEVELHQNALPVVRFKTSDLNSVELFYKPTGYGGITHGVRVWNPNGTRYIVLDGRITITPVKNDA